MTNRLSIWASLAAVAVLALSCLPAPAAASGSGAANPCGKAKEKLAKAKKRLATLKQHHASSQAIQNARRAVKKAKNGVKKACEEPAVLFDVTGISGKFDATVTRDPEGTCMLTKDAHWTSALGAEAAVMKLEVYSRDRQGRPIYVLSGPAGGIPLEATGHGQATETCSEPYPGSNGTTTCTFQAKRTYRLTVGNDPEASRDPMTLNWYFGYSGFQYEAPTSGGSCTYSGAYPPSLTPGEDSPGLFVNTNNTEPNALEPLGVNTISLSSLEHDTTLTFSGSSTAHFGGTLEANWDMSVGLKRR